MSNPGRPYSQKAAHAFEPAAPPPSDSMPPPSSMAAAYFRWPPADRPPIAWVSEDVLWQWFLANRLSATQLPACQRPAWLGRGSSGVRLLHAGPPGGAGGAVHDADADGVQRRPHRVGLLEILRLRSKRQMTITSVASYG